jgi:flagellar protein FlaG
MSIHPVGSGAAYYNAASIQPSRTEASRQADAVAPNVDSQAVKGADETEKTQLTQEQLAQAVTQIQDVIKQTAQSLQFSIDKDTGKTVVKVVDTDSKKVIRQIPSEEVLAIAKALDKLQGLLVKQKV